MLQIGLAVRFKRNIAAVAVKIVQRHQMRTLPQHAQVHSQPVGKGGFAAGGGAEDHHHARAAPQDLVRDTGDGFVVQRLVDADKLPQAAITDHPVHIRRVFRAQDAAPPLGGGKLAQEFGARHIRRGLVRIGGRGRHQHHAGIMRLDRKGADHTRGGQHGSVKIFAQRTDAVHADALLRAVAQKLGLVQPTLVFKVGDGLFAGPFLLLEGQILPDQLAHVLLDGTGHFMPDFAIQQAQIQPVAHGVEHARPLVRIEALEAQKEQEAQRPLIDAPSFLVLIGERLQHAVLRQRVGQLHAYPALHGAQNALRLLGGQHRTDCLARGGSGCKVPALRSHRNMNHGLFCHCRATSLLRHPQRACCWNTPQRGPPRPYARNRRV